MALVQLVREALGTDHSTSKPARPELTLVVEADHADSASTPDGVRLSDGSTRAVRCDADLLPLIVDSLGIPLDLGRRIRLATEAQRRAIRSRDGGCAFPGCDAPHRWCEAHHCVPWSAEHGRTDCANLVSLCRHHHSVVHREG